MPSLENLHSHFQNEPFIFLAIDVGEKEDTVEKYINDKGYTFSNLLDQDMKVSTQYGVRSHPMKFIVNKKGELIGSALGYREWDTKEIKEFIRILINS